MADKVLDASAAAALLFNEPDAELVAGRIDGHRLLAPNLISYELANVCLKKIRRDPRAEQSLTTAFRLRFALAIEERLIDPDAVLDLAVSTGLSVYDASYLWLSRALAVDLITLDQKLARTAAS